MTTAADLLRRHFETLLADNARWQTLIADDVVWELVYAPSLGHPARLSGREEAVRHVTWFLGAVENFRFFDLKVNAFADRNGVLHQPPTFAYNSHGIGEREHPSRDQCGIFTEAVTSNIGRLHAGFLFQHT